MILKFLGIMDLLAVLTLIWSSYTDAPWRMVVIFAAYLMLKGYAWRGSMPSFIDFVTGVYLLISIFFASTILSWILTAYIGFKGMRSISA